jgi:hypothetical protein
MAFYVILAVSGPFPVFPSVWPLVSLFFMALRKISVGQFILLVRPSLSLSCLENSPRCRCFRICEIIKWKYEAHGQLIQNVIIDESFGLFNFQKHFYSYAPQNRCTNFWILSFGKWVFKKAVGKNSSRKKRPRMKTFIFGQSKKN